MTFKPMVSPLAQKMDYHSTTTKKLVYKQLGCPFRKFKEIVILTVQIKLITN
jgi:hypothetical protein